MSVDADLIVAGVLDAEELRNSFLRLEAGRRTRHPCRLRTQVRANGGLTRSAARVTELCANVPETEFAWTARTSFADQVNEALPRTSADFVVLHTASHIGGLENLGLAVDALRGDPDSVAAALRPCLSQRLGASIADARPLSGWGRSNEVAGLSPGLIVVRREALLEVGGLDDAYETDLANLDVLFRLVARGRLLRVAALGPPVRQRTPGVPARDHRLLARHWASSPVMGRAVRRSLSADGLTPPTPWHNRSERLRGRLRNLRSGHALSPAYRDASPEQWKAFARQQPSGATAGEGLDVLYLVPALAPYGGIISVLQLVNRLCVRGIRAGVATWGRVAMPDGDEVLVHRPVVAPNRRSLPGLIGAPRLLVTTSWDTVYDGLLLRQAWGCAIASFVQDYEPDFYPVGHPARAAAAHSLQLIDHKIVKTDWLAERLDGVPGTVHQIPLGLNLDVFSRPCEAPDGRMVVSAARPGVDARNLDGTLEILRRVSARVPSVEVTFFGRPFHAPGLPARHTGPLSQRGVADLLQGAAALVDASRFQAFGRPGLEAMACGVPAALTSKGGINQYARHGDNCLQFDPCDPQAGADAVVRLLEDGRLRTGIISSGQTTAERYDVDVEAERTLALFETLM